MNEKTTNWSEYLESDRREQEQLGIAECLVEDAMRDTVSWLLANPLTEENVYLSVQERLAELGNIIARQRQRHYSPRDGQQWRATVGEVLSLLKKTRKLRGNIVGKGLARFADHLPKKLPGDRAEKPRKVRQGLGASGRLKNLIAQVVQGHPKYTQRQVCGRVDDICSRTAEKKTPLLPSWEKAGVKSLVDAFESEALHGTIKKFISSASRKPA